jgi:hypothetical protein
MLLGRLFRRSSRRRFDKRDRRRFDFSLPPGERVVLTTRSVHPRLYERSQSLITLPYPRHRMTGLNQWYNARDYLYLIFEHDADWVINVDEDCYVFDNGVFQGLVEYMQRGEYDYCGIPDGGSCIHRFHNPLVMNPFFNVFNAKKIRALLKNENIDRIEDIQHDPSFEKFAPEHLMKPGHRFAYDNFECFYGFFFWLLQKGLRPLYLPSVELEDGLTTELRDHENRPFAYHTWFAREYEKDEAHTRRIDGIYALARDRQAELASFR